ncbi:osmoprotectant NAGGN system M42 family peptidase [Ochrobactrum sp. AN78]|uniref:osmoprotectant NAGGN system M42 family peptidase n=1 Tax=Ochrobactrum sp. AN78 TaxID=3039853 RepID=UPI0021F6F92B|nr:MULTISPECIES: osmoprotectant NAGGN system M42 family peptidase [Brucella/Ochrobactrum group]MCV9909466.1 osmoprotectant NAGGN system M42 family peptidase [Brucella sp. HL-2]MDH7791152.1 peptidase M42 family hydrolase [Ochrobactrum sp. AN78]
MTNIAIDQNYLLEKLGALLAIPSPTGFTDEAVHYVARELERLGLEVMLTRRGAIRARRNGNSRKPARGIVSHLDTLGAQVKYLKSNGRLELVSIGNWSARFAEGARVSIFSSKGTYRGSILPLKASGHTFNDEVDTLPVGWTYIELRVDALARNKEDLIELGIDVGDIVAVDPMPEFIDNGFIVSRHLDDKAGVAIMLASLEAMQRLKVETPVDTYWLFTIGEEVGVGASAVVVPDIASLVAIDNGTTAPGQNSSEFGVTLAMADQTGPFDYHLTKKLYELCGEHEIPVQKDVFRYYRSDAASAVEAGHDVRTALLTFGVDASHGYERIHLSALTSIAKLTVHYAMSDVEIKRDAEETAKGIKGFTHQKSTTAEQDLKPEDMPTE